MKRTVMNELLAWKEDKRRKPLILQGARQVGKTWILREFGKTYYKNVAEFNFDENPEYKEFFAKTKDGKRILDNLSIISGTQILPHDTLIIFDEIQECPDALNSLKYFCEKLPEYHITCAGSYLGIQLARSPFPVGKVNFISMYPMTFTEFLQASGDENLSDYLKGIDTIEPIPEAFYNLLYEKIKMYYATGGMPEVVDSWTSEHDPKQIQSISKDILDSYERDFFKHPTIKDIPKINLIWKSLPSQLAKENKKFIYNVIKGGARAREYENALQWIVDSGLAYKIYRSEKPGLPLNSYDDLSAFKIYMLDVGLLRQHSGLSTSAFGEGNRLFTEFKGALTENYVLQSLMTQVQDIPRYWSIANPNYEVDYMIQIDNDIYPVEVKAETNIKATSLKKYKELYDKETKLRIRFSMNNLKLDEDVLNIPLFMADEAVRLIKMVVEEYKLK
ncbi:MAG: ATP-binding protein [Eubacterium sp.]|nr:ATP-binding protein [Eubacterium sp.]